MPSFECRCGAFYCDAECQRNDWPIHKDICMPRLVPITYSNKRIIQEATASRQSAVLSNSSPSDMPSHNQNQRRGQTNKNNNQGSNQQKNQNKQQQQKSKTDQPTPKKSPVEASPPDEKVSGVMNKLQRLKIAKSAVGAPTAAAPVMKGVLLPGVFPREGSMVKITASLPSGVVYIYHNNGKEGGQPSDYYQLTNRMFKAAADAKPLAEVPSVDDIIFAPFIGGFYRAKVLSVSGEKLEVFFVDFGNSDTVQWKQSREIADGDLKWAKYLTFPVMLEGVDAFTTEMMKLLETLEHVEEFELVKAEPAFNQNTISVVLKRPKQSLTLNMELIEAKERELRQRKEREEQKERERLEKEREKKQEQEKLQQVRKEDKVEVKIADPSNYQPVLFDVSSKSIGKQDSMSNEDFWAMIGRMIEDVDKGDVEMI